MNPLNLSKKWRIIRGAPLLFGLAFVFEAAHAAQPETRGVGGISLSTGVSYRDSWAVVIGINHYTKAV